MATLCKTNIMGVLQGRHIRRLIILRAHHHHRRSLVSYKKIKGTYTSYDEPSFRRWCKPPMEKTEKIEKIPRGSLPVYVGPHEKRYIIPMAYLTMPDFESLMETAAEEFGFKQQGGLKIPCDEDDFMEILSKCLENHKASFRNKKWAKDSITTLKSIGGLAGTARKEGGHDIASRGVGQE